MNEFINSLTTYINTIININLFGYCNLGDIILFSIILIVSSIILKRLII